MDVPHFPPEALITAIAKTGWRPDNEQARYLRSSTVEGFSPLSESESCRGNDGGVVHFAVFYSNKQQVFIISGHAHIFMHYIGGS